MKMNSFVKRFIVFVFVLNCCSVFGQNTDTLKYKLNVQVGGQRKTGVFSQNMLRIKADNKLENKRMIFTNLSSYTYNEVNGNNIANDWHFRTYAMVKLKPNPRLLPIFAHNYLRNVLYRISSSNRALTGIKIIPFKKRKEFSFLFGAGYESSSYNGEVFMNSSVISNQRNFLLGFFKVAGKHSFGKHKILLEYTLFSVQSFEEATDYSFWLTSGLTVPIGKILSMGIQYDFRFRNVHIEDIPDINDAILLNLRFNLSN